MVVNWDAVYAEMERANYSFYILIVGILTVIVGTLQLVFMIKNWRLNNERRRSKKSFKRDQSRQR